jgi:hypothetical protein
MDEEFEDEQTSMRWLIARIAAVIEEAERVGRPGTLSEPVDDIGGSAPDIKQPDVVL